MPKKAERNKADPPNAPSSKEERIRKRAYELYLARGREPGKELEDWLRAEQEINREEERERQWKLSH